MKKERRNAGFTLIELIAVVVIIGILAAVIVISPSDDRKVFNSIKDKDLFKVCYRYVQAKAMQSNANASYEVDPLTEPIDTMHVWGIHIQKTDEGGQFWMFRCESGENCSVNDNIEIISGNDSDKEKFDLAIKSIMWGSEMCGRISIYFDDYGVPYASKVDGFAIANPLGTEYLKERIVITLDTEDSDKMTIYPETGFIE